MDDQEEILKSLQDLLEAVDRGFLQFHDQQEVLNQEEVFLLFMELVDDIVSIEENIMDILDKEKSEHVEFTDHLLGDAINKVVESYQEGDFSKMKDLIQKDFEREYLKFKKGLLEKGMPYTV